MTEITKTVWDALPRAKKKKHKDGSTLMLCHSPEGDKWVEVFWKR